MSEENNLNLAEVLQGLSPDEIGEVVGAIRSTVQGVHARRQQAGQDGLRQGYDAELQKIMAANYDGSARVRHIAALKSKYRQRGLEIW